MWFFICCKTGKFSIFKSCAIITMWGCWKPMPGLQKCFKFAILCSKYSYTRWVCASHQKRSRVCPGSWQRDITRLIERLFTFYRAEGEARPGGKNYLPFQLQIFTFQFWTLFQTPWISRKPHPECDTVTDTKIWTCSSSFGPDSTQSIV